VFYRSPFPFESRFLNPFPLQCFAKYPGPQTTGDPMPNTPESLVLEHLRVIRTDVAIIKADLADVKAMQLRMREDFNRFEGDLLRFERIEAGTQLRLDRIETRLNLTDAE